MKRAKIRYAIEESKQNYAAYVPHLPGCLATGRTREEIDQRIRRAIAMHRCGLREDGLPFPESVSHVEYVGLPA
ncbi:MAG: type II toxin-antitoxin system HicB family antitoxin [Acidobacteriota bacterium]